MKTTSVILALSGTTLAVPFADVVDAMFGTKEARHAPHPDDMPNFPSMPPMGSGSGMPGFPMPTASGAFPFPMPTGGMPPFPKMPGGPPQHKRLAIDYQLAPAAGKRQDYGASLPSFSLANPTDGGAPTEPTSTEAGSYPGLPTGQPEAPFPTGGQPDLPFPTGGFPMPSGAPELPTGGLPMPSGEPELPTGAYPMPSGEPELPTGGLPSGPPPFPGMPSGGAPNMPFPTGGFPMPTGGSPYPGLPDGLPGTGMPGLPTTMATLTRGPQPTAVPEMPGYGGEQGSGSGDSEQGSGSGGGFFDWISGLFGGSKSETSA